MGFSAWHYLEKEARRVRRTVDEILEATELAQGMESILDNAAVLLVCRDLNHPARDIQGAAMAALLVTVLCELGPSWSEQQVGYRRWLICPDQEATVVIGPGFVAAEDVASGRRQLSWPPGDNYLGRWGRGSIGVSC